MHSKQALRISALASIAVHLAVLLHANPWSISDASGLALPGTASGLRIRMLEPSPSLAPLEQAQASTQPKAATHAAPQPEAEGLQPAQFGAASTAADSLLQEGGMHTPQDYVPSEYLSFVPKPLAPVEIPFPEAVTGDVSVHVQLSLFIDETGQVNQVRVDNAQPLSLLQDAAINTFITTRFKAGELDGHVVRSLLRVEVIFEAQGPANAGAIRKSSVSM